jgi:site-specific recombinase XerD
LGEKWEKKMSKVSIVVYHDNRKESKSGLYPVVLRINADGDRRAYPVFYNHQRLRLSNADFQSSYNAIRPKNLHREYKTAIEACYIKAQKIVDSLDPFVFETFEMEYMGSTGDKTDLLTMYDRVIAENEKEDRIKNAEAYLSSKRSIADFFQYRTGREVNKINYKEITPQLLKEYQKYMTDVEIVKAGKVVKKKLSISTVGSYTRALRAIFNRAIDDKIIHKDLYPFGKNKQKFQTPAGKKVKKGLSKEQVQAIYNMDLSDHLKAKKARDFWLLSYVCNGMQFKDIAHLKYKNISGEFFHFVRHKTKNTTIGNQTPITVPITAHVQYMIDTYGNARASENFIFPIINDRMDAKEKTRAVSNFTRFVSQNLKSIAKELNLDINIANMVARHTFATAIIRSGQSIEYAQKAMGHQSKRTTDAYFNGFEDKELLKVNAQLLDFGKK